MRILKSNYVHKNKISNDTYTDSDAIKNGYDLSAHREFCDSLVGFVQNISQVPYVDQK